MAFLRDSVIPASDVQSMRNIFSIWKSSRLRFANYDDARYQTENQYTRPRHSGNGYCKHVFAFENLKHVLNDFNITIIIRCSTFIRSFARFGLLVPSSSVTCVPKNSEIVRWQSGKPTTTTTGPRHVNSMKEIKVSNWMNEWMNEE